MTTMTYQNRIALLSHEYFNKRSAVMFLTLALGCRYVSQTQGSWKISEVERPAPENYPLVRTTFLRLVTHYLTLEDRDFADAFALLDGLANHDAWRIFLENRKDSQTLAFFLIGVSCWLQEIVAESEYFKTLSGQAYPALCGILNDWLVPSTGFDSPPPLHELAKLFFGQHWCDLFIGDRDEHNQWVILDLVNTYAPAVRCDLLPAALATPALPLPSL